MRAVTAILLAPFAILALEWGQRERPYEEARCVETDAVREAWVDGVAPAAFVTGCICLVVVLRLSAARRQGRPGAATLTATGLWLALAIGWWAAGEESPVALWSLIALFLAIPALLVPAVTAIRPSRAAVTALAWVGATVFVPAFVALVETTGTDFSC
jgi:hypothetical protein